MMDAAHYGNARAFIHNAGGDAFDKHIQPRYATFTKDVAVAKGPEFYLELYRPGWATTDRPEFRSEETAAIGFEDGSWWIGLSEASPNPFEYEVAPYPRGPKMRQGSEVVLFESKSP
jgi:hypothetical protein